MNENAWISNIICFKFVPKGKMENTRTLRHYLNQRLHRLATHICVTLLQWVNQLILLWAGLPLNDTVPQYRCDDVIKWKHFPRYWPFVWGIQRAPLNSPHRGQWHGALMFSLICSRINGWVNNSEAGDLRRHCTHYDVIVMINRRTMSTWYIYWCQKWFTVGAATAGLDNVPCVERVKTLRTMRFWRHLFIP